MDDPIARPEFSRLSAKGWAKRYPVAVIDEAQNWFLSKFKLEI
jgi:hypothetical protein